MKKTAGQTPAAQNRVELQDDDGLVSIHEAGKRTGVPLATVSYWLKKGRLEVHERGVSAHSARIVALVSLAEVRACADAQYLSWLTRLEARRRREARLYAAGLTCKEIGAEFDVMPSTVFQDLRAVGVALRRPGPKQVATRTARTEARLTTRELAALVPCSIPTVLRHARTSSLSAHRCGASWLFEPTAVEQLRALLAEGRTRREEACEANLRKGRSLGRSGVWKPCPHCGQHTYLKPCEAEKPGFCSHAHWARYRTDRGLAGLRTFVHEYWSGQARQRWLGRWGGRSAPPGGRPREAVSDAKRAEILKLADLGWGRRAIASRVLIGERAIRNVLAERDSAS